MSKYKVLKRVRGIHASMAGENYEYLNLALISCSDSEEMMKLDKKYYVGDKNIEWRFNFKL